MPETDLFQDSFRKVARSDLRAAIDAVMEILRRSARCENLYQIAARLSMASGILEAAARVILPAEREFVQELNRVAARLASEQFREHFSE